MSDFHAWYLPGRTLSAGRVLAETAGGRVLAPVLSAADVASAAAGAAAAAPALQRLALDDAIAAIDAVARRFLDGADPLRQEALRWLPAVTGYTAAMCALVLDRMAADWTAAALRRLLRAEFRDHHVLDRFVRHAPGQYARALPPRLAWHVLAGNVPGVGVTSLVRGLLVRAPALCKTAHGEPVLPVLFARALAERAPGLAASLAVAYWPGGDTLLEAPALQAADVVIHYGAETAVADLRARVPAGVRVIEHGPRISFAAVAREHAHRRGVALGVARAAATFDQLGCVSPHLLYVEEGGRVAPPDFAARVAAAFDRVAEELPRGRIGAGDAAVAQQLRATVEFRAIAGEGTRLWSGEALGWTVAYDPDPGFTASCLGRFLWVKPMPDLAVVADLVRGFRPWLQTAAIAAPRARCAALAELLASAGCSRITTLRDMPFPPPSWHHDGRGPLRELVRWADWEPPRK